mmetsp:Transcript_2645/g.5842  ORF Transcript_2645/g.5842 Transcript_2645/m.5842 type:complete len:415 (+) Transcript_2645:1439-2683(+)
MRRRGRRGRQGRGRRRSGAPGGARSVLGGAAGRLAVVRRRRFAARRGLGGEPGDRAAPRRRPPAQAAAGHLFGGAQGEAPAEGSPSAGRRRGPRTARGPTRRAAPVRAPVPSRVAQGQVDQVGRFAGHGRVARAPPGPGGPEGDTPPGRDQRPTREKPGDQRRLPGNRGELRAARRLRPRGAAADLDGGALVRLRARAKPAERQGHRSRPPQEPEPPRLAPRLAPRLRGGGRGLLARRVAPHPGRRRGGTERDQSAGAPGGALPARPVGGGRVGRVAWQPRDPQRPLPGAPTPGGRRRLGCGAVPLPRQAPRQGLGGRLPGPAAAPPGPLRPPARGQAARGLSLLAGLPHGGLHGGARGQALRGAARPRARPPPASPSRQGPSRQGEGGRGGGGRGGGGGAVESGVRLHVGGVA